MTYADSPKFKFFGNGDVAECALTHMAKSGLYPSNDGDEVLGVVVSYGKILTSDQINSFKFGILNIHPSMLPKLRGASPIKSAILENLETTGVSIMVLDEKMDHGLILAQEKIALSPRIATSNQLRDSLIEKGVELLAKVMPDYVAGKIAGFEQDHSQATFCSKFKPEAGYLPYPTWGSEPQVLERKVRALNPEPGTYTNLEVKNKNVRVKILEAKVENNKFIPTLVQPAGKKAMTWEAYLNGNPII